MVCLTNVAFFYFNDSFTFYDGFTNTMHELISDERDFSLNVQV